MKKFCYSILSLGIATSALLAQNYEQTAPKVPAQGGGGKVQEPGLPEDASKNAEQVIIPEVKGLVFLPSPRAVYEKGILSEDPIYLEKVSVPDPADFRERMSAYIGKPFTKGKLNGLICEIILYYRAHDKPIIDVIVPRQDITDGYVQVILLEGKIGKVKIEGNKWFSTESIKGLVRTSPGVRGENGEISSRRLLDDLDAINQNPFRAADVVFSPGNDVGVTDVTYKVQDRFPVRFYTGYENTGNALTGEDRYLAGFNWGDAFFQGHMLNYQYTASHNFGALEAHSASYIVPLPWRHTLTLFGSNSSSSGTSNVFDVKGSGSQLGARYDVPLPRVGDVYTHKFTVGYDWKQSDNSLEFGAVPLNASTVGVGQYVFGYSGSLKDDWGVTSVNPQIYWSPFRTWNYQDDASYQSVRAGSSTYYTYFKLNASRLTRLPWDCSLSHELIYQNSNHNLLPSEQMNFGGNASIRGYGEWDVSSTDGGWVLRNELRAPPIGALRYIHSDSRLVDQLQFLVFFDYGRAEANEGRITLNNGKAVDSVTMASFGPGVRYSISQYLSAYADYGFQLYDTGDDYASRVHFGLTLSY